MRKILQYFFMTLIHWFSKSQLDRRLEPNQITDLEKHVDDYDKAVNSIMMLPYALVLDFIHRLVDENSVQTAIDLCCGPGHFTRLLARQENCQTIGVDLSQPMLERAKKNADKAGLASRVSFLNSDVKELKEVKSSSVDLVTFLDGAHHMQSQAEVNLILQEAERVIRPNGVIIVMDPIRQKSAPLTEQYHRVAGKDYVDRGMSYFNKDFYDSLYASWTPEELAMSVPKTSKLRWVQITPFGLPTFQIIIGVSKERKSVFLQDGLSEKVLRTLIQPKDWSDWKLLKSAFAFSRPKDIQSQNENEIYQNESENKQH